MNDAATKDRRGRSEGETREQAARHGSWILPATLFATLLILYFTWPPLRDFADTAWRLLSSEDQVGFADWIEGYGAWGPLVILATMLFQTLAAFIPSLIIMVVTVLAYGPLLGGALNVSGLLLAAAMAYWIGRALGEPVVRGVVGETTEEKIESWMQRYGFWTVVAFRLSPILSSDGVSYVGGLLGMRFPRFMAATAAGVVPFSALVSWFGEDIDRLEPGLVWGSVVTVVALVGWIGWDWWKGRGG